MFGKDKNDKKIDLAQVQAAVRSADGANLRNLSVRQNGSNFEVLGQADSLVARQEAFKKIVAVVGDTSGVVNSIQISTEPGKPGGTSAARPAGMTPGVSSADTGGTSISRNHVVRKGETLGHIAQNYFGKASDSKKILEANRDQLKDPDKIREGMTLKIPS